MIVAGHLTIDEIEMPRQRIRVAMGGTACYASLGARLTGIDVRILSKIGGDFPENYLRLLRKAGINLDRVERVSSSKTTRFRLTYIDEERTLKILARAPAIKLGDLDEPVYLGPVAWEISLDEVKEVVERGKMVALDPQGVLRQADADGVISLKHINPTILRGVNVLRLTSKEAEALTGLNNPLEAVGKLLEIGVETVLLSMGSSGVLAASPAGCFRVPAYPVEVVDPTGAGDVLGGCFFAEYLRSGELEWSVSLASAAASLAVETQGPEHLISVSSRELRRRAETLLERVERL